MMHWTVTYTIKLSGAEFYRAFFREKSASYGLQNAVCSPHNIKHTHSVVPHHNPNFMYIYAVLLYFRSEAFTVINIHTAVC
jgi:hypothetical protein